MAHLTDTSSQESMSVCDDEEEEGEWGEGEGGYDPADLDSPYEVHIHTHTYTNTYTNTYIHTYIHIY
jgi:hypothetical protein